MPVLFHQIHKQHLDEIEAAINCNMPNWQAELRHVSAGVHFSVQPGGVGSIINLTAILGLSWQKMHHRSSGSN